MPKRGTQRQRGRLTADGVPNTNRNPTMLHEAEMTAAQAAEKLAREMPESQPFIG